MSQSSSYKITFWFNAACLSLLLPLFVSSNTWAQNCTPADVKEQIQKLKDDKSRKAASDELVKCGENAIAPLALALNDNPAIRAYAASTLGKIGADAQSAVPALVRVLKRSDETLSSNATSALVQIAEGVQKEADNFTEWDLEAVQKLEALKQSLDKAVTAVEQNKQGLKNKKKYIDDLSQVSSRLETRLEQLKEQTFYQVVKWVKDNPWFWLAVGYLVGYLGIFIVRPIWLLKLDEWVKPATFTIPVVKLPVSLRYLLFLKYHPRVLDAWVRERIHKAKEQFEGRDTVKKHEIYVAEPILLNEHKVDIPDFNAKVLKDTFSQSQVRVVIWGEGGSGKTSLACQIAKWAMKLGKSDRICQHPILPILIEDEFDGSLLETIGGLLKELTQSGKVIPEELLKQLLRQQRILLIVDHLSEMGEETRKKIQPDNQEFPANALIVTSRLKNILGSEITPTFIEPFRISVGSLASFLNRYLEKKGKAELFDGLDYSEAYRRLEGMASVRQVETKTSNKQGLTILLVKLYAEQMIAAKEGTSTDELPDNVPDLMLQYLNELNKSTSGELSHQKVHEIAQLVAWKCIEPTFKPESADCKQVLINLEALELDAETAAEKAKQHLQYLESRLYLVRKKKPDLQTLRFTLDPLAEYLAGLHLVQQYGNDEDAWREILAQAEHKPGFPEEIKGFLLALRDCCEVKGKRVGVPEFVVEELGKKAGLDPEVVRQFQRQRRVRMLIQELSAPEAEYRARAAEDLVKMGKDAKPAIPRLRRLLNNDSEVLKTRRETAKTLKQLGEEIPMLIAEIKDGIESIRLVEHPPTEEIDLGNGVILEMVEIPGGTFLMGSPPKEEESSDRERPQHQVTVAPFLMGKYPITQAQWQAVAALPQVERELKSNPSHFQGANRPVEQVNWYDAVEFCARVSQHTGREFRLPSEAEWEYACRAGTTTPFQFGETISTDLANYNGSYIYGSGERGVSRGETTPVGMFQVANAFGLYDMHGNVWEWCLDDWHDNYEGAPTDGSAWFDNNNNLSQKKDYAVLRGGSWLTFPVLCRSAYRDFTYWAGRDYINYSGGFRVVCAFGRNIEYCFIL
ncbi:MAG: SUMF1/EgtB/PvdO family nonheme iron enzyme [Calothrix sp. MO_192.B10]|nr:SUMF1/EgtB/PvdO family nonheme iron enzyme [Calothrix sp. MO_192.B10]